MAPKSANREHRFSMVMTDDERAMLEALAEADNRSAADWVRVTVKTAHAARFGESTKKKTKPKK